jgi:hypothetical protein
VFVWSASSLRALRSPDATQREGAALALNAVLTRIGGYRGPDAASRRRRDRRIVVALIGALVDDSAAVRAAAGWALSTGKTGRARGQPRGEAVRELRALILNGRAGHHKPSPLPARTARRAIYRRPRYFGGQGNHESAQIAPTPSAVGTPSRGSGRTNAGCVSCPGRTSRTAHARRYPVMNSASIPAETTFFSVSR